MSQSDATVPARRTSPGDVPPGPGGRDDGDRRLRVNRGSRAFRAVKAEHAADMTQVERLANRLTLFASSTPFLVFHVVWFGGWIGWNVKAGKAGFDPFPFGLLSAAARSRALARTGQTRGTRMAARARGRSPAPMS